MKDNELSELISLSGYYELKDISLEDLSPKDKAIVILSEELFALRPELKNPDPDILYIVKNGEYSYTPPSRSLKNALSDNKPYNDASVWIYSLKEDKLLKRIYKGDGVNWRRVK